MRRMSDRKRGCSTSSKQGSTSVFVASNNPGGRTSSSMMQCSVKSSDSMHCNPYWVVFVQFLRVVCVSKALWFAAAIGNMQFSWHGKWARPYPGIYPTFWQHSDACSTLRAKVFQGLFPIQQTWMLWALACLICKSPWIFPKECDVILKACPTTPPP